MLGKVTVGRGGQEVQAGAGGERVTGSRNLAPLWPEGQRAVWKVEAETFATRAPSQGPRGITLPKAVSSTGSPTPVPVRRVGSGCLGSRGRGSEMKLHC